MSMPTHHPATEWERASEGFCAWGSSPFWHPREERLYWLDTRLKKLWRRHVPSGSTEHWDLTQEPGAIAPCRSGGLLMALRDGIYLSSTWHDIPQKIATAPYDAAKAHFTSGGCDPWGRFWVGSNADSGQAADRRLYCLHKRDKPRPELLSVMAGTVSSDAMAWSPDGSTLYWSHATRREVDTYSLLNPGQHPPQLHAGMPLIRLKEDNTDGGHLGAMAVDQKGHIWIAVHEGARVLCLNQSGEVLAEYATPAQNPTMLCFGGHDLRTLYLTTSREHRSAAEIAQYPDSGAVFSMRVDTPGLPMTFYED